MNSLPFGLQYAGSSWDELKHIRQAVGFLVCALTLPLIYLVMGGCAVSHLNWHIPTGNP